MSQESLPTSSVPLKTAAYLTQSAEPEQAAGSEPSRGPTGMTSLRIANGILGVLVIGALIPLGATFLNSVEQERGRRKCGLDWMLWAVGSNETFESRFNAAMEESRRDFERQMEESVTPFEFKNLDLQTGFGPAPLFSNRDGFHNGRDR